MSDDINTISTNNISETQSLNCGANVVNMGLSTPVTTPEPKSTSIPSGSRSEIHYPGVQNPSRIYESKKKRKIVRIMTVMGYMFAVSLAAIVLSLYYAFIWNPNMQTNNSTNSVKQDSDTGGGGLVSSLEESDSKSLEISSQNEKHINVEPIVSSSQLLSETKTKLDSTLTTVPPLRPIANVTNVQNSVYSSNTLSVNREKENAFKLMSNTDDMGSMSDLRLSPRIRNNKNMRREITREIWEENNRTEINIIDNQIEISLNTNSTQETIRNDSNSDDH